MYENYIIDGNAVYEIDEECIGSTINGKCKKAYLPIEKNNINKEIRMKTEKVEVSVCDQV